MVKASWILFFLLVFSGYVESKPRILVIATGGTIAGVTNVSGGSAYNAAKLPIYTLIKAVPQASEIAELSGEQLAQVASQAMTNEIWLKLARRINEVFASDAIDGVVVTHGTDTLEETAYFLNLTVHSKRPVVVVGAMRPANGLSADGPKNLYDAVVVASDQLSQDQGVLVVMNDRIHSARDVVKMDTTNTDAFQSEPWGVLGAVYNGRAIYHRKVVRKHTSESEFSKLNESLPRVDIIYGHAQHNPDVVASAVKNGAKGIVMAGVGNGNLFPQTEAALIEARKKGLVIVRSSRVAIGGTTPDAEVDDRKNGFIVSDSLNPQKARVLLCLALTKTNDREQIQEMFYKY